MCFMNMIFRSSNQAWCNLLSRKIYPSHLATKTDLFARVNVFLDSRVLKYRRTKEMSGLVGLSFFSSNGKRSRIYDEFRHFIVNDKYTAYI